MTEKSDKIYKNTPQRIVVKANLQNYTFPKETYHETFIGHLIKKEEYDRIIASGSKILSQAWMKKRDNDKINLPPFVTALSVISILLTVVYMILIYYSTTVENGTALLIVSIVCVVVATLIAFGLSIYNFCRKMGTFKTVQEIIKEDLHELFSVENRNYFERLNFSFNDEGNFLEIKILRPNTSINWKDDEPDFNQQNKDDIKNFQVNNQGSVKGSKTGSRQGSGKLKDVEIELVNQQS